MQYLTAGVLLIVILIHSADMCILVMACVDSIGMCSLKPTPASLRDLSPCNLFCVTEMGVGIQTGQILDECQHQQWH